MNKPALFTLTLITGIALGALSAYWFVKQHDVSPSSQDMVKTEAKPLFYRNPMNPDITSPTPAKDYMGMDYIPVYADGKKSNSDQPTGTVEIDPVTVQNMGVRTATATVMPLSHDISTAGRVAYDEEHITRLHPKTEGWIDTLFIDKTGTTVENNTMLLSIYSPKLVTSSQEYLLALKSAETLEKSPFEDISFGARQMVKSARERLAFLDVPEHQIKDMEQTGEIKKNIHIHSPFNGVVINIGAREGQYVSPQTELYMLADLSTVWVYADVYESELPWVKVGDSVEMTLTGIPGKTFTGSLSYIYPYAEAKTRTIKVRLVFDNSDLLLKPDMFANVIIHTQQQRDAITVPSEAVIRSGERNQVFVVREQGKFEPREVEIGLSSNGLTQIVKGVSAGEEVVTSSQFLIDSESKLRESTAKMLEAISAESINSNTDNNQSESDRQPPEMTEQNRHDPQQMDMSSHTLPMQSDSVAGGHQHD
ncbi:MAG: efflux RND transporter periplasmic adaptor subunit [Gammaproteobacteria bacterium]|nr:efflux RND transporter periplasmic adaptor subunit [Gammaproteobacteria bacterium]